MEIDDVVAVPRFSKKRAAAIGAKFAKKYPYKQYGRMYMLRGSQPSLAQFGPSWKEADEEQRKNRKEYGFVGRGKYKKMIGRGGYWGRAIGNIFGLGDLGDAVGDAASGVISQFVPGGAQAMNLVGSSAGQALGKKAAGLVSAMKGRGIYTGRGAYVDNSIIAGDTLVAPHFTGEKDGASVTISHREFIGNLYAPPLNSSGTGVVPFVNQAYDINPGLERTFPWLSQIAANYEEYEMKQLIFTYRSTVTDFNSGTGQVGQVLMATQYNSNRDPFYEKVTMMQYDGAMSGKTSHDQLHGVECDPRKLSGAPGKYIRVAPVLEDQDKNDYDAGQFNIALADLPKEFANQAMGEIWVSYTVHLRKPKFFTGRGLAISRDIFVTRFGAAALPFSNSSGSNLLSGQQNNIGCQLNRATGVVTFPAAYSGNLKLRVRLTAAYPAFVGLVATGITGTPAGNVALVADMPIANPTSAVAGGEVLWTAIQQSTDSNPSAQSIVEYEAHIRVSVATNGVDNTWTIGISSPPTQNWTVSYLEIEEYNVGLNYALNGTNDEQKLIDPNGVIVNI